MTTKENETPQQWEKRHEGHITEEFTPERPFETRSLYCYDCKENAEWKGQNKLT